MCCISPTGISPSSSGLSRTVRLYITCPCWWSATPEDKSSGLASFPFARRYLGNRCFFLFLGLLRCFSSPRFLLACYVFTCGYSHITASEFPHSEICGSMLICSSPQLIAACHVLLRLPVPRHPPCALIHLNLVAFLSTSSVISYYPLFAIGFLLISLVVVICFYTLLYSVFKVHVVFFQVVHRLKRPWPKGQWWRIQGSNLRPPACKAGALPAELIPHKQCIVQEIVFP